MTGFRSELTDVALCSRALSMLPEEPIASMDVGGLVGRTCRIWYKPTVAWLLEQHHWNLATKRVTLAEITNTRSTEWRYAYARPTDLAFIKGLAPLSGDAGIGYYHALRSLLQPKQFAVVGNTIFANIQAGAVDYVSYDVTEAEFDETFANVIALSLASRFAQPITKKAKLAADLKKEASDALILAMTHNANEEQPTYGDAPTETELTRGAIGGIGFYDSGWPAL